MAQRRPDRQAIPAVQRLRIRYAKRGRLRFTSHRDFQRALERAVRRADVPIAYSAGFSPHPKISYANAAPTGAASEAEYVEIALVARCDPAALLSAVGANLPAGLDLLEVAEARTPDFVARLEASQWLVEFPGVAADELVRACELLLAADGVSITRRVGSGERTFDVRGAVVSAVVVPAGTADARLTVCLRHSTPAVRADDVVAALRVVADLAVPLPPILTRLRQGPLGATGEISDPLEPDRAAPG